MSDLFPVGTAIVCPKGRGGIKGVISAIETHTERPVRKSDPPVEYDVYIVDAYNATTGERLKCGTMHVRADHVAGLWPEDGDHHAVMREFRKTHPPKNPIPVL